jgi:hypothetical protein
MRTIACILTLALALTFTGACGGGGHNPAAANAPAAPTPPASAVAQFVNGLNLDEAVSGLLLVVGGAPLAPTSSDGRTAVTVPNGARVTTSGRTDFLERDTRFSVQAARLLLWPLTASYGGEYVRALVYDNAGAAPVTWVAAAAPSRHPVSRVDRGRLKALRPEPVPLSVRCGVTIEPLNSWLKTGYGDVSSASGAEGYRFEPIGRTTTQWSRAIAGWTSAARRWRAVP